MKSAASIIDATDAHLVGESTTSSIATEDPQDIALPHQNHIGGSLVKLVYYEQRDDEQQSGRLRFRKYETHDITRCFQFVREITHSRSQAIASSEIPPFQIVATGGGAFKYYNELLRLADNATFTQEDEMESLILGLDFFITSIPNEIFIHSDRHPLQFQHPRTDAYPYLLVNIGSGVSILKVSSSSQSERVGGTSLGGGTLWGLLSLLTEAATFDEMLALADRGDNRKVDMLVGDIYGTDYNKIGLSTEVIASSFGKVFKTKYQKVRLDTMKQDGSAVDQSDESQIQQDSDASPFSAADISVSLLKMVSNNIGQLAYLFSEKHQLQNIYFGGSFIRGHLQTISSLTFAINFWSAGTKQAHFLRHDGYLGAMGAFLKQ